MSSENAAPTVDKTGLTAKELALYIGVPVATICVAGGLYYYFNKKTDESTGEAAVQKNNAPVAIVSPQVTAEEGSLSPLEVAQAAKSRGNKYFNARRFEQAIECYTKAIENCPQENLNEISTFFQNKAAACEQLKQWKEVVENSSKAIDLNPKYTKALARRARAYEALDEKRSCLEDVTAVYLLEGFQSVQFMEFSDSMLKSFGKQLAEEYIKKRPHVLPSPVFVKSYLNSFNKDIFYVDLPDDELDSIYGEILRCMSRKQYDGIIELCTKEIDQEGKYSNYTYLLRGTLYTLMSDIDKAMDDFNNVMKLEGNHVNNKLKVDALIKLTYTHMQEAKEQECYMDFSDAIEIDANNTNIYHHRGQLYFLTDRLNEAQADFKKAISLDPKFVAPRLKLVLCLCEKAKQIMNPYMMQEANKMMQETTESFPESSEAWSLYGQLLQDQQELDQASEKLEKAISIAPDNPTIYVYKALLTLQWKQDLDTANALIRKAIEIDEKCDFAIERLAKLEVQKGNSEEAVRLLTKAIDLVRTEAEMANTFSMLEEAKAQTKIAKQYGITLPTKFMLN